MTSFVVDENLPRSLAIALERLGHTAKDVRDHNLRGRPDGEVYAFAQQEKAVLITNDVGFANLTRYPLSTHHGIIAVRLPDELPAPERVLEITTALSNLDSTTLAGALVIISPGKVRIRRKP